MLSRLNLNVASNYESLIFENVSDVIITTDLHFNVLTWNKSAEEYYCIPIEEAKGHFIFDLVQFEFYNTTLEQAIADLQNTGTWKGQVSFTNKKGETKNFLHSVQYLYNDSEQQVGVLSIGRNITDTRKAKEKLVRSERFYRALIGDSLDAILLMDTNGIIDFASQSTKKILGFEITDILGENAFSFVHPDDVVFAMQAFNREVDEKPEVKSISIRLRKKSGEWLWCMVRGHNLLANPYVNRIAIYFHDDTLRKAASDAHRNSEKRFRSMVKDMQIGVMMQNPEGTIIMCNRFMENVLGVPEEDLKGKKIYDVFKTVIDEDGNPIPKDQRPTSLAIKTRQTVKDKVIGVIHPHTLQVIWLLMNVDPIFDEKQNLIEVVCSFANITFRKKLEEKMLYEKVLHQKQLTKAMVDGQEKERLEIGKELHDNIGQQLTTIKLFLDLAKTTADDNTLEMINLASKGVSDVINETRALSRSLVPSAIKDLGLIDSVQDLLDTIRHSNALEITFCNATFEEDSLSVEQKIGFFRIIQEQLNNILKHSGASNVHIKLSNEPSDITLLISDDGKGFDMQNHSKGLGLSNILSRAELMGGRATISSTMGDGCTVKVSIPALTVQVPL
ncbi:MAG: PAS domain S-box protein [Candidatus Dadabacteria bacterium]